MSKPVDIVTVSEITRSIRGLLESTFSYVSVKGEVTNFKEQASGHLYFSIKDDEAQLSCVMFKPNTFSLQKKPRNGDSIVCRGRVSVYPPMGRYQMIVDSLSLSGIGELLLKLNELKIKLKKKGYFEQERKKPLPLFPKTIGVITSPTGAAIADILTVLKRRHRSFHLILNPVKVQGEGAAEEIAKAIEQMNKYNLCDVLIVGRGGGSFEDLFAFNEEIVADAIFHSKIPILCAVGHETDHAIAEYVADQRAATPSQAAEICIKETIHYQDALIDTHLRLKKLLFAKLERCKKELFLLKKNTLFSSGIQILAIREQKLDLLRTQIDEKIAYFHQKKSHLLETKKRELRSNRPLNKVRQSLLDVDKLSKLIEKEMRRFVSSKQSELIHLSKNVDEKERHILKESQETFNHTKALLSSLDPRNVLKKGYAILFSEKEKSVINSASQIKEGQSIQARLQDGVLDALITNIRQKT